MATASDEVLALMRASLSGTSYDIAHVVHAMYRDSFVSVKQGSKFWFRLDQGLWKPIENGPYCQLSTDVFDAYQAAKAYVVPEGDDEAASAFHKLMKQLKTANQKDAVCRECTYLFFREGFLGSLDSDPALVRFRNGVFVRGTSEFRLPSPSDMISLYIDEEFDPEDADLDAKLDRFSQHRASVLLARKRLTPHAWDFKTT